MAEPKIRFKREDGAEFPAWEEKNLSDVLRVSEEKNKGRYSKDDVLSVSDEFGVLNQIRFHGRSFAGDDISGYKIVHTDQIIYTRSPLAAKPYGIIKIVGREEGIVSPLYIINDVIEPNNPLFIYYLFDTPERTNNYLKPLVRIGAKHTMNISTDEWLSGFIFAPCAEEQEKIADFLSSVDEIIAASEQEVANLETQKKAVMKEIFSQEVRFKKEDGTDFPEWEVKLLGEVAEIKDSARVPNNLWKKSGVPYYRAKDFNDGNLQGELFISYEDYVKFKKNTGAPELGDLMFVSGGNVGLCVLKKDDKPVYVQGGAILYVRTSVSEHIEGSYLLHYFSSEQTKKYIKNTAVGGTIIHFTLKPANSMPVLIPCLEEQNLIADFLSSFDDAISAAKKELKLWKQLKKGLLQQMFV